MAISLGRAQHANESRWRNAHKTARAFPTSDLACKRTKCRCPPLTELLVAGAAHEKKDVCEGVLEIAAQVTPEGQDEWTQLLAHLIRKVLDQKPDSQALQESCRAVRTSCEVGFVASRLNLFIGQAYARLNPLLTEVEHELRDATIRAHQPCILAPFGRSKRRVPFETYLRPRVRLLHTNYAVVASVGQQASERYIYAR